jgi:hypothetical protein
MNTNRKQTPRNILDSINAEIIANPSLVRNELATKYGVDRKLIDNAYLRLRNKGAFNVVEVKKETNKALSVLEKVTSAFQEAKKTGNTYNNHNGENKEVARTKMANIIIDSGIGGVIPSLPNKNWAIEQKINNGLGDVSFIGIEMHEPTFIEMKANLKQTNLKAEVHFGKFSDKIYGKIENTYAHLIMDYCANLSTISKEVEYAINNDVIGVGGIMAITFSKPIRGTDFQSTKLKNLGAINNADDRCMSDKSVEAYFNKITGWNYQVVEFFYYQDTYPMTLVLIRRIK